MGTDVGADVVIRFRGARKEYANGSVAVAHLDLDVRAHELLALVGPSGCGKSTTLRMVNRLVEPTGGSILLNGKDVTSVDPVQLRRGIGYVIQHVGLFPHRTVAQNAATVPGLLGWDKRRTAERVNELLDLVGLDPDTYGPRYPHELSGGERQRVGVARALATDPPILLMDEPFGAVDPEGRRRLQSEFRRIQAHLGTTVMLVTHDVDEAVSLADRVAVLSKGAVVEQVTDPTTLLVHPANQAVERFIGAGRSVRLLGLGRLVREDLEPLSPARDESTAGSQGAADPTALRLGASLEEALSRTVDAAASTGLGVPVLDDLGRLAGTISSAGVVAALSRLRRSAEQV